MTKHPHIIRTFHPIGQGAFYSERFFDFEERTLKNIVYDCGVEKVEERHKKIVRASFTKDDIIDYLFISHLDNDHISLVKTLKESVQRIYNVVLPYINREDIELQYSLSLISNDSNTLYFWRWLRDSLNGERNAMDDNESMFHIVLPEEEKYLYDRNNRVHISGVQFQINNITDWIFIPFIKHLDRVNELDNKLEALLDDTDFKRELSHIGIKIDSLHTFKQALTRDSFADLISNDFIKKKLQEAYKNISGTINQNSLLVYSGPSFTQDVNKHHFIFDFVYPFNPRLPLFRRFLVNEVRVACLYTGDSDFDMAIYKRDFGELWDNVGTIQLPHHGSLSSFKLSKNKSEIDRSFVFPVSCGETNRYGHPSSEVLAFLVSKKCNPIIVTENCSTLVMQLIVRSPFESNN